ncbi:acyltransferase ChoActase/COT/CPT [Chytridium lagenaria]|nr:acyltransferase ChoActase/COT/CPT [Chytridium lagenaria]
MASSKPIPVSTFAHQPDLPQYARSEAAVKEFIKPGGLGEVLQTRLQARDKVHPGSWLEEWWLQLAYHGWRESVLVNSNWYMIVDSPPGELPKELEEGQSGRVDGVFTAYQVKRAAGLITRFLDYKDTLDRGALPAERTKAGPICMDQYRRLFGITRVPKPGCDINVGSHPFHSRYIVVSARDQLYKVEVIDATGARVMNEAIEKQLWAVVEDVKSLTTLQPPVSILTAEHRDTWAEVHKYMEDLCPENRKSFSIVEGAIFNLSLDDYFMPSDTVYLARNTFYGKGGFNRWYDKSMAMTIMADGRFGVNGEHSPCDALVPAMIVDYAARQPPNAKKDAALNPPTRLNWTVDAKVSKQLKPPLSTLPKIIADSDVQVTYFGQYGAELIKKKAKVSPDAYVQMALQLTYFRIHKKLPAVYETASVRKYHHGRTETCRSLSLDSAAFLKAFADPSATAKIKIDALRKACTAHVDYISKASNGFGVDRHLLGLRMCIQNDEERKQAGIYADRFTRVRLPGISTSGLFPGPVIAGTGFGAVIGVESKVSCKETSSVVFCETFQKVLADMRKVVEENDGLAKL